MSGGPTGPDCARPLLRFADGRIDGAIAPNGRVMGAYVHGLFADDRQRAAWLAALGAGSSLSYETTVEATLDALADHWKRISTAKGFSALRGEGRAARVSCDGSGQNRHRESFDQARQPVEPQRAANVGRRRLAPAVVP